MARGMATHARRDSQPGAFGRRPPSAKQGRPFSHCRNRTGGLCRRGLLAVGGPLGASGPQQSTPPAVNQAELPPLPPDPLGYAYALAGRSWSAAEAILADPLTDQVRQLTEQAASFAQGVLASLLAELLSLAGGDFLGLPGREFPCSRGVEGKTPAAAGRGGAMRRGRGSMVIASSPSKKAVLS